jgi:hypothetical protein
MNATVTPPNSATGEMKLAAEITDKSGYGERWGFARRTIDNLIAQGLPHLKIGKRRVRICIPEADAWMWKRFGQQRQLTQVKSKITSPKSREAMPDLAA